MEIELKWLFGLAKPFNLYVLQVKDSEGLILTAIPYFSQQFVPKPDEVNQDIPTYTMLKLGSSISFCASELSNPVMNTA